MLAQKLKEFSEIGGDSSPLISMWRLRTMFETTGSLRKVLLLFSI
jgi:hypothetical protein